MPESIHRSDLEHPSSGHRASSTRARRPTLPTPLPLIGRSADLEALRERAEDDSRTTSTVVLAGEGGVGKSRLAAEFAAWAAEAGWTVVRGRAYPVETGIPYALFGDAFTPLLRDMDPARLAVLSRGGETELAHLFPAIGNGGRVPDVSGDPEELRTRLMWNFTQFVKSHAARDPLVLVLEDLQWADGSSLELLHFLARQVSGHPVLILCTYNEQEREPGSELVRAERSLVSLGVGEVRRLAPLTREEVGALLQRTFDVAPSVVGEFSALLYGWTRGNVFFLEEILKSMVATGRLRREGGTWIGWDVADLELPGSIRDAVLGRMSALSDEAQAVVELASVVGARARHPVLARLAGLDETALFEALEELRHHHVLGEREENDVVVYVFEHPIVRQTLYEELGLQRARVLHERVAEALEAFHGSRAARHADELAYHYARSAGEARAKATEYLVMAGRQALERRAHREAVEYLETALEGLGADDRADPVERGRVMATLARARQHLGDFEGAVALWSEAVRLVRESDPAHLDLLRSLGLAHFWCGHHEEAHAALDRGLALAEGKGEEAAVVRLRIAKGHCLHEVGRGAEALETVLPALPLAESAGDVGLLARIHRSLALLHVWIGPPEKAREHGGRAIELAREAGDVSTEFWARWGLGVLTGMRGGAERMREAIDELTELADRARAPILRLWTAEMEIELAYGQGDWDAGVALGERAIALARDLHQRSLLPRLLVWTSQFYLGRGEVDRARELIDEAMRLSGIGPEDGPVDVHQVVPALIGAAHYRVGTGDYVGAIEAAERGLEIAEGTGYTLWAVHRLLPVLAEACLWAGEIEQAGQVGTRLREHAERLDHTLGTAWADACDALVRWKRGDPETAVDLMRGAARSLEAIPMIPYAARIRRQLAGRLLDVGEKDQAVAELKRVHETCVRLGAEPELEKTRHMFAEAGHPVPAKGTGAGLAGLTDRETEVACSVARRLTNQEVGAELGIATRTVSTHLTNIYEKLGIGSRGELIDLVREAGLA
ncbi:MAG: AAA family ATPase [Gemmatimonadota bacterium]